MVFVPVTEREGAKGKGQTGEGAAGESNGRTRAAARARGIVTALSAVTERGRAWRVAARPTKPAEPQRWEAEGLEEALADTPPSNHVKVDRRTPAEKAAPDVRGRSLWHDGPASPADQWVYLRSGAWAPGEQHWAVELLGRIYGLYALVVTLAVAVPLWVIQRPSRFFLAVLVGMLWWGATLADGGTP